MAGGGITMSRSALFFRLTFVALFVFAVVLVSGFVSGADEKQTSEHESGPPSSGTSKDIAMELEAKRDAVKAKEASLEDYEKKLKEREVALDSKLKELEALRDSISGELEGRKKNNEDRVQKMVTVFETMTPKAASAVLETTDDWLSVEVLKKMDTKRMAKIMNVMDKSRSARLSELMTGYVKDSRSAVGANASVSNVAAPSGANIVAPSGATRTPAGQAAVVPQPAVGAQNAPAVATERTPAQAAAQNVSPAGAPSGVSARAPSGATVGAPDGATAANPGGPAMPAPSSVPVSPGPADGGGSKKGGKP